MALNKLYLFIKKENTSTFLRKKRLRFKQDNNKENYALYELELKGKKNVTDEYGQVFRLTSHHLSFYEEKSNYNPKWRQYHYTAYFENGGKKFKTHVFFDQNDVATQKDFYIENDEGEWVKQPSSDEFYDSFVQFAVNESFTTMVDLRRQYQQTLDQLEMDYNQLADELTHLSGDLIGNHKLYNEKLENILILLTKLKDYHNESRYQSLFNLFSRIKISIEHHNQKTLDIHHPPENTLELSSNETTVSHPKQNGKKNYSNNAKKHVSKKITHKSLRQPIEDAINARNHYITLLNKNAQINELVTAFQEFHSRTYTALVAIEEEDSTSLNDLQKIRSLLAESNEKGRTLLDQLLSTSQYWLADALTDYFLKPIPNDLIESAIATGNANLLDYLLREGTFPINTPCMPGNLTPLLYCFLNHSDDTPKLECLSVLIKHHASLMVKANDGFSVAYHIFSTPHHPLKIGFFNNTEITLARRGFYEALLNEIEEYLLHYSGKDKVKIRTMLMMKEACQKAISKTVEHPSNLEIFIIERIARQTDQRLLSYLAGTDFDRFKTDEDYVAKYLEYKEALTDYAKKLQKKYKERILTHLDKFLDLASQYMLNIYSKSPTLKKDTIHCLDQLLQVIAFETELLHLQVVLQNDKSSTKVKEEAFARQSEILSKLKSEYSFNHDNEDNPLEAMTGLQSTSFIQTKLGMKKIANEDKSETKINFEQGVECITKDLDENTKMFCLFLPPGKDIRSTIKQAFSQLKFKG